MKKFFEVVSVVLLLLGLSFTSFRIGKRIGIESVPRILAIDADTKELVPIQTYGKDEQVMVISPNGDTEPGVMYAHTKDGRKALLLPKSMVDDLESTPSEPPPPKTNTHPRQERPLTILAKS